ncbi:phage integrase N-terminal domain-containing protein [Paraburkholderia sp. J8-2]|uniref:phage integrase N-terminal domain-containing protein n=1 Tax=Paraburkholderia sp. J8-2 TaxID=2805440 RepID=UPI002AB79AF1|nr:phage integrase N-terminal domain-containing protein [Paraburkholderia sp. J8-2]
MGAALKRAMDGRDGGATGFREDLTGWKGRLQALINERAGKRMNGQPASNRTIEATATVLFDIFNTLHGLGFKIQDPRSLGDRHVEALVICWYEKGAAIKTMQTKMSMLRKFATWIGKKGLVRALPLYLKHVPASRLRHVATITESKSWTKNDVDVDAKYAQADEVDERFGLMLRLGVAFGLRRKEILMFSPWKADRGDHIAVYANAGPKNGRARTVPITNEFQRQVLELLKARISKTGTLGWTHTRRGKPAKLKYQIAEYSRRMAEIGVTRALSGVTGHGLRMEFIENSAMAEGMTPPTLGGTADQMPREDLDLIRGRMSEMLGHSRLSVMNSYYGSFGRFRRKPEKPAVNENHAPGKATPAPVVSRKVSESGNAAGKDRAGAPGFRKRKAADVDARQMDLQLHDGVLMFRKRPT